MQNSRAVVRAVMYGAGTHRRFMQESPILPDVWAYYLEHEADDRAKLLIVPWWGNPPFEVARRLRERMRERMGETPWEQRVSKELTQCTTGPWWRPN